MTMTGPPTSAVPVVRIAAKRAGIDRVWGRSLAAVVVLYGLLLAGVVALAVSADASAALWILVPMLPMLALNVGFITYVWGSLRAIDVPIELAPEGVTFRSMQGVVRCPWEAIASVHHGRYGRTDVVVFQLHPQAGPGAPGIESTISARGWRTVRRHGLRYAAWLLDVEPSQLDLDLVRTSAGRVRLQPKP